MSEDLTVTYAGLNADEKRVVINDKRAVRLRHGCAITELRALDRTASELQETCHKQAQRIAELEQAARQALEALEALEAALSDDKPYIAQSKDAIAALREALSGVQALSAAPAGFVPVSAFDRLHAHAESLAARLLAASPTPPAEQQAAPKAAPQQEAQEPHGWLYDWTHSSATGKPDETYTAFTTDEAHARKHDNCRAVFTAPQPAPAPLSEREAFEEWYCKQMEDAGYGSDCTIHQLREENHYGEHRVMLNGKWEGWQARAALAAQGGKE